MKIRNRKRDTSTLVSARSRLAPGVLRSCRSLGFKIFPSLQNTGYIFTSILFTFSWVFSSILVVIEVLSYRKMPKRANNYTKGSKNKKPRKKRCTRRSHEFSGNQHTAEHSTSFTSKSAEKLSTNTDFDVKIDEGFSFCILAFQLVFSALATMLKCKTCDKDVKFTKTSVHGLGFKINVACECGDRQISSCNNINTGYEINRRIVFVMRLLGVGMNGLNLFCSLMDMTSNFSKTTYYRLLENVKIGTKAVSLICIEKAGKEEKQKTKDENLTEDELAVSGDGTWAKRGFSSLIGVCTVVGKYSGKILDYFVSCKTCGMEVQGMVEIFKNSEKLHNAKYAYYIGDGDSKTFTNIIDAKPYGNFVIQKLECVLHVGKRMFRHLKDVKKTLTEVRKLKKAEEKKMNEQANKEITQKEPKIKPTPRKKAKSSEPPPPKTTDLTGKVMKDMSAHYSLAIQRNPDSLENMKKEIWAGFYHKISTDALPQHEKCNPEWCKYLKAKADNTPFMHKPALSAEVQELVKPVFEKLTNDELLSRCLGRNTQNNNECYNFVGSHPKAYVPRQRSGRNGYPNNVVNFQ